MLLPGSREWYSQPRKRLGIFRFGSKACGGGEDTGAKQYRGAGAKN